jgi:D-arginine dehydrogenase
VATDFLVVGGGIAGASAGYFLADHGRVTLVEAEEMLGFHSTGRSAALFSEYYGITALRALTAASRSFLAQPPPGFADHPLLTPRGPVMSRYR